MWPGRPGRPDRPARSGRTPLAACAAAVVLAALALAPVAGCQQVDNGVTGQVRIATGNSAAVYYRYGLAYRDLLQRLLPRVHSTVLTTPASGVNVAMVEQGQAEVGFTQADIVTKARPDSLAAIARIYDDCLHLVVRSDDPAETLPDLHGRTVSMGEAGSGTEVTAGRLLTVAGLDPTKDLRAAWLGLDASVDALRLEMIDAFFFSGGLPVAAITALAAGADPPDQPQEYVAPLRSAFGDHYAERVIPGSNYRTPPVVTIGIPNYLVVASTLPEPMAYALTWALFSGREDIARAHPVGAGLSSRNAIGTPPLRLHPGAARYYRSSKI
jgi:TRAP transporter TAXI family solute receptor